MNPTTIRSRCGQLVGDSVTNITSAFEASFAVTEMALGIPWFFAEFTPLLSLATWFWFDLRRDHGCRRIYC